MDPSSTTIDESKFKFAEKRGHLDWKAMQEVDMDRLLREVDIDKLERMLQNLTYSSLEKADLKKFKDKNLVKLFKLGQLSTEYLLFTHGIADTLALQRQREYEHHFKEAALLQDQLKANQRRINALRDQDKVHKNTLKTYEALLSNNEPAKSREEVLVVGGSAKCMFCLKSFTTREYLTTHYKKRHFEQYVKEGLENQENVQLMANLISAADKVNLNSTQGKDADVSDEFVNKLKEEVFSKYATELAKLTGEMEQTRRAVRQEEETLSRTVDQIQSRDLERIKEVKEAAREYEERLAKFKQDISKEVTSHYATVAQDVQMKVNQALEAEVDKERREEERAEEIRQKIEREFADQFEQRFNLLEQQLKEKEKVAQEAKSMLEQLQAKQREIEAMPKQPVNQPVPSEDPMVRERKVAEEQEKAIAELRKSQQDELSRFEALLQKERDSRVEQQSKLDKDKEERREQKRVERQRLIDEAVMAAKSATAASVAAVAEKAAMLAQKQEKSKAPKAAAGDIIESDEDDSEDDGEFFVRDKRNISNQKAAAEIESFMNISKQHQMRGFGTMAVGGKQSQASAFEDDDDEDVSPIVPKKQVPVPTEIKKDIEVEVAKPQVEDSKQKSEEGFEQPKGPQVRQNSSRQKKLDDIIEDVEEEDKEGTQENPFKSIKANEKTVQMADTEASKQLRSLIESLELSLTSMKPKHFFMAERYKSENGSTTPFKTIFKHTKEDIESGRKKFLKAQLGQKIAENLKSFGFSNRIMIDQLSRAECKHVSEEMARRSKADASRFVEADKLIEQLTGRKKPKGVHHVEPAIPKKESNIEILPSKMEMPAKEEVKKAAVEEKKKPIDDGWDEEVVKIPERIVPKIAIPENLPQKSVEVPKIEVPVKVEKKDIPIPKKEEIKKKVDEEDWVLEDDEKVIQPKVQDKPQATQIAVDQAAIDKAIEDERIKDEEIKKKIQQQIQKQRQEEEESKKKEVDEKVKRDAEVKKKIAEEEEERKKKEAEEAKVEEIVVDQSKDSSKPVNELLAKVLVLGDNGVGKSTFIQQFIGKHSKFVKVGSTTSNYYYQSPHEDSQFQFLDFSTQSVDTSLLQDPLCVLLCYNNNSEASLTSLKTKWMPQLQKHLNKAALKCGILLLGISFTKEECSFQHKVALFVRGFSLTGKSFTWSTTSSDEQSKKALSDGIKQTLEKVSAMGNQSFVSAATDPPESSRSKAVAIPTEEASVSKPVVKEDPAPVVVKEIEDIIAAKKSEAEVIPQIVKEPIKEATEKVQEPPKKVEQPEKKAEESKKEEKKAQDDDYDDDFE